MLNVSIIHHAPLVWSEMVTIIVREILFQTLLMSSTAESLKRKTFSFRSEITKLFFLFDVPCSICHDSTLITKPTDIWISSWTLSSSPSILFSRECWVRITNINAIFSNCLRILLYQFKKLTCRDLSTSLIAWRLAQRSGNPKEKLRWAERAEII